MSVTSKSEGEWGAKVSRGALKPAQKGSETSLNRPRLGVMKAKDTR